MRYRRALIAGAGSAGSIGVAAVCLLVALSAYVGVDGDKLGHVGGSDGADVRLPAAPGLFSRVDPGPSAVVSLPAAGPGDAPVRRVAPRRRAARPLAQERSPAGGSPVTRPVDGGDEPESAPARPPAAPDPEPPAPASPTSPQESPAQSVGGVLRDVTGAVGEQAGQVSPALGEVVTGTGDGVADVVDEVSEGLAPLVPPPLAGGQ